MPTLNGLVGAYPGLAFPGEFYPSESIPVISQADAESVYGWMFAVNSYGQTGQRRQAQTMVLQSAEDMANLLLRITSYETYAESNGVPVDHEWGQLYGTYKRRLLRQP